MLLERATKGRIAVSFTGGKDCVLALHLVTGFQCAAEGADLGALPAQAEGANGTVHGACAVAEVCAQSLIAAAPPDTLLVTFVPKPSDGEPVRFKAHPLEVVKAQASALGMQHLVLEVEGPAYLQAYQQHIRWLGEEHGVTSLVTGDILDVCNGFMAKAAEGTGVELVTPLWHGERRQLLHMLHTLQIHALVSCVNVRKWHKVQQAQQLAQQRLQQDQGLQAQEEAEQMDDCAAANMKDDWGGDAPAAATALLGSWVAPELCSTLSAEGVDPCGEHGEFHTMVTDAPLFKKQLVLQWEPVREGDFAYLSITSVVLHDKSSNMVVVD